ncbi:MAG TPA: fatty acid desaturase [Edaphocola sp.]|nr:fatty acid desaturase [Edaphocola sp.]
MESLTHQQKSSFIRKEINASYKTIKSKYPILRYQNFWGLLIFIISISAVVLNAYLWWQGSMSSWLMIILNAFFFGVLHELEHDLIHWMYFKSNKVMHHFMMLTIWMLRPITINPWIRRQLHYHHHKYSGTLHDVEERGVTNGEKWGLKRLLLTPDLVLGGLTRVTQLFKDIQTEIESGRLKVDLGNRLKRYAVIGLIPITIVSHLILYLFAINLLLNFLNSNFQTGLLFPAPIQSLITFLNPIIYIILLPNVIRQFCLHLITSNIHYYADIEDGNVIEQTQVLNRWWTTPFQVFCFFFGWTHAIHHFVVNETFYVRHLTRKKAYKVLRKYGVRFNDFGTFKRANRFNKIAKTS